MPIDSIVVAVHDLSAATADFEQQFGLAFASPRSVPEQQLITTWAEFGSASLQVAAPLGPTGPISSFLRTRKEGISGVTVRVESIERARERFVSMGLVRPETEIFDSGYARELPLRPSKTHGVLFIVREWNN